jgi:hypothetical protein
VHILIAGGFVWVCVGMPVACGLGSVLRSAAGRDEARWRVLGIADTFLAATALAAEATSAGEAAMDAFVIHRHRSWMARVELAAALGETCDAVERTTGVLAALARLAADRLDGDGRHGAAFEASRAAFARAVWDAVGETGASGRQGTRRMPPSCASTAGP